MTYVDTILADYPIQYRRLGNTLTSPIVNRGAEIGARFNQYLRTGTEPASTFLSASAWTIGLWVRVIPSNATSALSSSVFIFGSGSNLGFSIRKTINNENYVVVHNLSSGTTYEAGVPVRDFTPPIHLAATNDGSTLSLYINGMLADQTATGSTTSLSTTINTGQAIGANFDSMLVWDMGTWDRVCSSSEISNWYSGTTPTGPTGFWPATEGTGSTVANSGGTAGFDLTHSGGSLGWGTDTSSFAVVGSVPTGTSLIASDPAAACSVFDGSASNYISGWYYDWSGADRLFECWVRPTAYQPTNTTYLWSTIYHGIADIKSLIWIAGGLQGGSNLYGLELGKLYHVITRITSYQDQRSYAVWINGKLVSKHDYLSASISLYGLEILAIGQNRTSGSVVAGYGFIGEMQEFASYAGFRDNEFANKHYNAGIDVTGYSSSLVKVESRGDNLITAHFSKNTYGARPTNFQINDQSVEDRYTQALIDVMGYTLSAAQAISSGSTTLSAVESDLAALVGANTITENESYQIFKKVDVVAPTPYKVINNFDGTMDIYSWRLRPKIYLKMNELSGTDIADSSGNGYDGYVVGSATVGACGVVEKAVEFSNGTTQYITAPYSTDMSRPTAKGFTVNFWIKLSTATGSTKYIVSQLPASVADGGWSILVDGTDLIFFYAGRGAGSYSSISLGATSIPVNAWRMITVVYHGQPLYSRINSEPVRDNSEFNEEFPVRPQPAHVSVYHDGVFYSAVSSTGVGHANDTPLIIGNRSDSLSAANGFAGRIAEFSYFDLELTRDEIFFLAQRNLRHQYIPDVGTPPDGRILTLTTSNLTDALNDPLTVSSIDFVYEITVEQEPEWEAAEFVDGFQLISSGETTIVSNTVTYYMRAYDTVLARYVIWTVIDSPDFLGVQYVEGNPADLTDIILFKTAVQE